MLQTGLPPVSFQGPWKDKNWRLCVYWCIRWCYQVSKAMTCSQSILSSFVVGLKHTVFIKQKNLVERPSAERAGLARLPSCVSPILPESPSSMDTQSNSLKRTTHLFNKILDHFHKDDGQLEFHLHWGSNNEATWKSHNNMTENAISKYCARMRMAIQDRYE